MRIGKGFQCYAGHYKGVLKPRSDRKNTKYCSDSTNTWKSSRIKIKNNQEKNNIQQARRNQGNTIKSTPLVDLLFFYYGKVTPTDR